MSATRPARRLFLHLSALSDPEYAVYVEALRELLDDEDVDAPKLTEAELELEHVGVREVRAWMKGRFRDLGVGEIDKVLHLFTPQMAQNELSGGQLLAALRLLMHVRRGGEIGEGNVFVQVDPSSPVMTHLPLPSLNSKSTYNVDLPTPDLPFIPTKSMNPYYQDLKDSSLPDTTVSYSSPPTIPPSCLPPPVHPSFGSPSKSNGLSPRRASLSSAPPVPPTSSKPRKEAVASIGVRPGTTNPFLQRAKTHTGATQSGKMPPLPPRKSAHLSGQTLLNPPPIPTKPSIIPSARPPLRASASSNSNSSTSTTIQLNPAPPPPPVPPHRVTPLMQQSLLASRAGATLKRAQDEAERTRVLEVIRSSSHVMHSKERTSSESRSPHKGTRRPVPRPPSPLGAVLSSQSSVSGRSAYSDALSTRSLEQIAGAQLTSRKMTRSPDYVSLRASSAASSSNEKENEDAKDRSVSTSGQFAAPPTHPARRPSGRSSNGRVHGRHMRMPSYQPPLTPSSPPSASPVLPTTCVARPTRSHSMHQTSSPTSTTATTTDTIQSGRVSPPLPPPRRKRPESMQVTAHPRVVDVDDAGTLDSDPSSPFTNAFTATPEKRTGAVGSLAAKFELEKVREKEREKHREKERERSPSHAFASLQRTFSALQQRAQPTLARARYKAEAGLAPRRGFVPNGRDFHFAGEGGDRLVVQGDDDADAGMDADYSGGASMESDEGGTWGSGADEDGEDTVRGRGQRRGRLGYMHERDDLKLPEGEGWAPL